MHRPITFKSFCERAFWWGIVVCTIALQIWLVVAILQGKTFE